MSLETLKLVELIKRPLVTLTQETSVSEALALARQQRLHHFPVVGPVGVVGLVCTCDLDAAPGDSVVADWMSHPAVALPTDATLRAAVHTMNENRVGSVVVTLDGKAHGILTRSDVLAADPAVRDVLRLVRCERCGVARHLRQDAQGRTLCAHCVAVGSDLPPTVVPLSGPPLDIQPLAGLLREHALIFPLSLALQRYAGAVESAEDPRSLLENFVRVFQDFADCVHHEKEETVLLPFLSRRGFHWETGALAEIRGDHSQERYLIDVLAHSSKHALPWDAELRRHVAGTARSLAEFQMDHIAKEDRLLFPEVVSRLSLADQVLLGEELATFDTNVARYVPVEELRALAQQLGAASL